MSDKAKERRLVEQASARLGWQAAITDRESPDFRLDFPDGTVVGLEVQETVDENTAAGQKGMERLCEKLEAELKKRRQLVAVMLSFHEDASRLVSSGTQSTVHTKVLVRLIIEARLPSAGEIVFDNSDLVRAGAGLVECMHVWASDETAVEELHDRQAPGPVFLQERIRAKEELLPKYRTELPAADEFWLLLVAAAHQAGSFPASHTHRYSYESQFDRIFFLDFWSDKAFEVTTKVVGRPF